jgi:formate-dependent nitrite reductase membrane component NrfD
MRSTEDDRALVRDGDRDRVHKLIRIGIWTGLCGAIVAGFLVALGTSVPFWSAAVAEFVLRWAVTTGFSAALLATVYWEVRA